MLKRTRWAIGIVGFLLALAAFLARDVYVQLTAPLKIGEHTIYEIPAGANFNAVLTDLRTRGYVTGTRLPLYLQLYARASGTAAKIKAGQYEMAAGISALDLVRVFISGKILLHSLQIVEGWSFEQALSAVHAHPEIRHTLDIHNPNALMRSLGLEGISPEGRFFPDTYHFPKGTTDVAFLQRAYAAMQSVVQTEWNQRAADLPYKTPEEALVMASIVEKETGVAAERALIAGVFVNRLRTGMRLQTDPTVIYGLGKAFDGNLRRVDLLSDNPFNTYTRAGLPPTPICLPGRASIHAALQPAQTRAVFFVSRGDGTHIFSETLSEHNAAVDQFQRKRHASK